MAKKKSLDEEFGTLSVEEIETSDSLQKALALINQEGVVSDVPEPEFKKFVVEKKNEAKDLAKLTDEEKSDKDLDEIANQADQAFYDLMDIAINTTGKACGDIASAANNFLKIKLDTKLAKMEQKYKKMNQEIQLKKIEMTSLKSSQKEEISEYDPSDDIIEINPD
jgi:hypothetical protein